MPKPSLYFDPGSGVGVVVYPDGSQFDTTLEEFSNGRFYISGRAFIDTENLTNPTNIGQQGLASLTQFSGGSYSLTSQTVRGSVNRSIGTDYLRTIDGTIDVGLPSGESLTLNIDPTHVAEVGKQWIAYEQSDGGTGYTQARGPYRTSAEVQADFGPTFRLASPSEAIYSALLKRVLTDNSEELDRIIEAYGIDETDKSLAQYNAATLAIKLGKLTNINTYSSFLFD